MHQMDTDKACREKAWRQLHENASSYNEQILEEASYEIEPVRPPISHL